MIDLKQVVMIDHREWKDWSNDPTGAFAKLNELLEPLGVRVVNDASEDADFLELWLKQIEPAPQQIQDLGLSPPQKLRYQGLVAIMGAPTKENAAAFFMMEAMGKLFINENRLFAIEPPAATRQSDDSWLVECKAVPVDLNKPLSAAADEETQDQPSPFTDEFPNIRVIDSVQIKHLADRVESALKEYASMFNSEENWEDSLSWIQPDSSIRPGDSLSKRMMAVLDKHYCESATDARVDALVVFAQRHRLTTLEVKNAAVMLNQLSETQDEKA